MIKANRIGLIGIVIAVLGICCAIFQDDLRAQITPDSPKIEQSVLKEGIRIFSSGDVSHDKRDVVDFIYMGMGILGLILGVISYIVKENHRIAAAAGALGVMAIAWQYVLIGVLVAVVLFFIGSFS